MYVMKIFEGLAEFLNKYLIFLSQFYCLLFKVNVSSESHKLKLIQREYLTKINDASL